MKTKLLSIMCWPVPEKIKGLTLDEVLPDRVDLHWPVQVFAVIDYYDVLVVNQTYDERNPNAMQEVKNFVF